MAKKKQNKSMEEQALNILQLEYREGESRNQFLTRLAKGFSNLSDEDWDGLSTDLQDWANEALTCVKEGNPVLEFPDAIPVKEESEEEDDPEEEPAPKKQKPKGKKVNQEDPEEQSELEEEEEAIPTVPKNKKKALPPKGKIPPLVGSGDVFMKLFIESLPDPKLPELLRKMEERNLPYASSSAAVSFYDYKRIVRGLIEEGLLKLPKKSAPKGD